MQSIEDFATDLARRAGQLIVELRAGSKLEKHFKGGIEIVTQAVHTDYCTEKVRVLGLGSIVNLNLILQIY